MNSLRNIAIVKRISESWKDNFGDRLMEQTETGKTTDTIQLDNNALEGYGITILARNTSTSGMIQKLILWILPDMLILVVG